MNRELVKNTVYTTLNPAT